MEITDRLTYSATQVATTAGANGTVAQPIIGYVVGVLAVVVIGYIVYEVYTTANGDGVVRKLQDAADPDTP